MELKAMANDRRTIQPFAMMNFEGLDLTWPDRPLTSSRFPWGWGLKVNPPQDAPAPLLHPDPRGQSRRPDTMTQKKRHSNEIANLLRKLSENEWDGDELSCSNLDFDEDIRLSESDSKEFE
ncbi:hypothetical protein TNCV_1076751 [Trichonephila clavipes]|uniref:Uncharacterized protein n=1 Tax=Trichonephila clavipes TaxID=2585209 RepID=A0A8X6V8U0_TRICX|nr:hypothetical protein TNCV_1076751 [Trichonephila clavipes]